MQQISNFYNQLRRSYKRQKPLGKVAYGCISIIIMLCLCSIPINLLNPEPVEKSPTLSAPTFQLASSPTVVTTTLVKEQPTSTLRPTSTATLLPIFTPTPVYTSSFDCIPGNPPEYGKVVEVVDGDTVRVSLAGAIYPVRYIGMDTPETAYGTDPFAEEASKKNAEMVLGKDVILIRDVSETDRYDRLLRYVFVGDLFVNYELVHQGYATVSTYPPDVACVDLFREAQTYASANLLGLWGSQVVITPKGPSIGIGLLQIVTVNKVAEYVDIQNISGEEVNLLGWWILSQKGNQRCVLNGVLQPGGTLRVWSKTPEGEGISCGYSTNIWNNSEVDIAILYDPQGQEIDRFP